MQETKKSPELSAFEVRRRDAVWIEKKGDRAKRTGKPVYLEHQWRPGWRASLPIYLLWCGGCQKYTTLHPHGYRKVIFCLVCRDNSHSLLSLTEKFARFWAELRAFIHLLRSSPRK